MKIFNLLFIIICLSLGLKSHLSFGQGKHTIDSLEIELSKAKDDIQKVGIMEGLAYNYLFSDLKQAKVYHSKATAQAKKINYHENDGTLLNIAGVIQLYDGHVDQAISTLKQAEKILLKRKDKKAQIAVHINIAMAYTQKKDISMAVSNYQKALKLSIEIGDKKRIANVYSNLGALYQDVNSIDSALIFHNLALKIREETSDSVGMAVSFYNIGAINSIIGELENAILNYTKSAEIFEHFMMEGNLTQVYNSMSGTNWKLKNYQEALEYNESAQKLAEKTGMTHLLPEIYFNHGLILQDIGKQKEAKKFLKIAIEKGVETYNYNIASEAHMTLGKIEYNTGQLENAKTHYLYAIDFAEKSGFNREIKLAKMRLAEFKLKIQDTSDIKSLLNEVERLSLNEKGNISYLNFLDLMTEYHISSGNFKQAMDYFTQAKNLTDSILSGDLLSNFAEFQTKYETSKKENEILQLNQQKKIDNLLLQKKNFQLFGSLFLLLFSTVGIFAYSRRQKLKHKLEIQQRKLKEIESNRAIILETEHKERQRIAQDLHDELGSGISKIVLSNELAKKQNTDNQPLNDCLYSIDQTISELSGNMKALIWSFHNDQAELDILLAKMREFTGDFLEDSNMDFNFNILEDIPIAQLKKESLRDIFLAYKEAINNVVKHAKATKLTISIKVEQNKLTIKINDNGQGITTKNNIGNGLKNMKIRIERQGGQFEIISNQQMGTTLLFTLDVNKITTNNLS